MTAAIARSALSNVAPGRRKLNLYDEGIASLKPGDFAWLEGLEVIRLDGNRLATLPAGLFDGMSALETLELQDNALTSLPARLFAELGNLKTLRLSDNALTAVPKEMLAGPSKLKRLELGDNALAAGSIADGAFEELKSLTTLGLGGNPGADSFKAGADAGAGRRLSAGEVVTLGGEGTGTGPWGSNVRYRWTQTDGADNAATTVTLSAADVAAPSFTAPVLASAATVKLTLTVTGRGSGDSAASSTATFAIRPLAVTDVSIVSVPQADDTYRAGETIEVAVIFGDTVLVDTAGGTPAIEIDLFNTERSGSAGSNAVAGYARGSGTNRLVFAYTVKTADDDGYRRSLDRSAATTSRSSGGTIASVFGARALLPHDSVDGSSSHKVDGSTAALEGGVCERTPQVRDALVAKVATASDCSQVSKGDLAALRGELDLRPTTTGSTMTGLKAGDFRDLSGLSLLRAETATGCATSRPGRSTR